MLRRRFILAGLAAAPVSAFAHAGHGPQEVAAHIDASVRTPNALILDLSLTNRGQYQTELLGIYAEDSTAFASLPLTLPPGETRVLKAALPGSDWPAVFTLILDFGEDGASPLTVVPR
ncbi:hypothetical protein [Pseudoruegeria sp. HB172150]|uniref:hypothetical protein n=1 Tax=Pseudoruegeria sp. HB172150 TaxID=2721164 RepID=UPI00155725AF|nr:hypothetical protein [Pseudoruegeria sp. HB172150]